MENLFAFIPDPPTSSTDTTTKSYQEGGRNRRFLLSAALFGSALIGGTLTHTVESWLNGDGDLKHRVEADEIATRNLQKHVDALEKITTKLAVQIGADFSEILLFESIEVLGRNHQDNIQWFLQALASALEQERLPLNLVDGGRIKRELEVMRTRFLENGLILATTSLQDLSNLPVLVTKDPTSQLDEVIIFSVQIPTARKENVLQLYSPDFHLTLINGLPYAMENIESQLLGVNPTQTGYTIVRHHELEHCVQVQRTYYCPAANLLKTTFDMDCLAAIWSQNLAAIQGRCVLRHVPAQVPLVKAINSSSVLLYNPSEAEIPAKVICGSKVTSLNLPTAITTFTSATCSLRTSFFTFTAQLHSQFPITDQVRVQLDLDDIEVRPAVSSLAIPDFETLPQLTPVPAHYHRAANSGLVIFLVLALTVTGSMMALQRWGPERMKPSRLLTLSPPMSRWCRRNLANPDSAVAPDSAIEAVDPDESHQPLQPPPMQPPTYSALPKRAPTPPLQYRPAAPLPYPAGYSPTYAVLQQAINNAAERQNATRPSSPAGSSAGPAVLQLQPFDPRRSGI